MRLRIGELAKMAGCLTVTIRFYEKEGLLASPERDGGNYRVYTDADAERLRFILHCRKHGVSLAEIRRLLAIRDNPVRDCAFAHELVANRLAEVEEQLASLNDLKEKLLALQKGNSCSGACSILERLEAPDNCPYCRALPVAEGTLEIKADKGKKGKKLRQ